MYMCIYIHICMYILGYHWFVVSGSFVAFLSKLLVGLNFECGACAGDEG